MYAYPLLQKILKKFSREECGDLEKIYIIACQHILEPQKEMFEGFVRFGVTAQHIFILGKIYSTNHSVLYELQTSGFHAEQPPFLTNRPFDEQHEENCLILFRKAVSSIPVGSTVVILDDGGGLLSIFNERYSEIRDKFRIFGVEQTSSGFRRLENENLAFPIINVARSPVKLNEENVYIALNVISKTAQILERLTARRALVVGLGPIGRELVKALKERNIEVEGFDVMHGHSDLMRRIEDFRPSLIIGATGSRIMNEIDVRRIGTFGYKTYLISVSSSDREFPVVSFRVSAKVHDDVQVGNVCIVNNGFPVTFRGNRSEIEYERIEPTIMQLFGSVLYCLCRENVLKERKGFIEVPQDILNTIR